MIDFIEHEALNLAFEDMEADSGNHEPLDDYLREEFLEGELYRLMDAADVLSNRCSAVLREKKGRLR